MNAEQKQQIEQALPPELLLLLEAFRSEFDTKLGNLKLWGSLALVGGGTLGGVISRIAFPQQTGHVTGFVLHLFT